MFAQANDQVYVAMPDAALPVALPGGWTVVNQGDPLTVIGPESDLELSFLARPVGDDIDDLIRLAWQQAKPGFDVPVRLKVEMPAKDGWHSEISIAYDTPESNKYWPKTIVQSPFSGHFRGNAPALRRNKNSPAALQLLIVAAARVCKPARTESLLKRKRHPHKNRCGAYPSRCGDGVRRNRNGRNSVGDGIGDEYAVAVRRYRDSLGTIET